MISFPTVSYPVIGVILLLVIAVVCVSVMVTRRLRTTKRRRTTTDNVCSTDVVSDMTDDSGGDEDASADDDEAPELLQQDNLESSSSSSTTSTTPSSSTSTESTRKYNASDFPSGMSSDEFLRKQEEGVATCLQQDITNNGQGSTEKNIPSFRHTTATEMPEAHPIPDGFSSSEMTAGSNSGQTQGRVPVGTKVYTRNDHDMTLLDELLSTQCLFLCCCSYFGLPCYMVLNVLFVLFKMGDLLLVFYSRGSGVSGFDWKRTRGVLLRMPLFARLIFCLEKFFFIHNGWVQASLSGWHPWHQDGMRKDAWGRVIFTIGGVEKVMWFEDTATGRKFGIELPHGSVIWLSKAAAGVVGGIYHTVCSSMYTWFLGFDIAPIRQ